MYAHTHKFFLFFLVIRKLKIKCRNHECSLVHHPHPGLQAPQGEGTDKAGGERCGKARQHAQEESALVASCHGYRRPNNAQTGFKSSPNGVIKAWQHAKEEPAAVASCCGYRCLDDAPTGFKCSPNGVIRIGGVASPFRMRIVECTHETLFQKQRVRRHA